MKNNELTPKEVIKQYFGDESLFEEYEETANEILQKMDHEKIKEECLRLAGKNEINKRLHISRLCISKVACIIVVICVSTVLLCGTVYAAVLNHIRSVQVKDMGNHSELEIQYSVAPVPEKIEDFCYYEPEWVPDGYYKETECRHAKDYDIYYKSIDLNMNIFYSQYTSSVRPHYSTENGKSEHVSFKEYSGEYIETNDSNYLIVTDGIYIFSLIAESKSVGRQELIKMIGSMIK